MARFVDCDDEHVVVFVRNTTEAIYLVAASLPRPSPHPLLAARAPREPAPLARAQQSTTFRSPLSLEELVERSCDELPGHAASSPYRRRRSQRRLERHRRGPPRRGACRRRARRRRDTSSSTQRSSLHIGTVSVRGPPGRLPRPLRPQALRPIRPRRAHRSSRPPAQRAPAPQGRRRCTSCLARRRGLGRAASAPRGRNAEPARCRGTRRCLRRASRTVRRDRLERAGAGPRLRLWRRASTINPFATALRGLARPTTTGSESPPSPSPARSHDWSPNNSRTTTAWQCGAGSSARTRSSRTAGTPSDRLDAALRLGRGRRARTSRCQAPYARASGLASMPGTSLVCSTHSSSSELSGGRRSGSRCTGTTPSRSGRRRRLSSRQARALRPRRCRGSRRASTSSSTAETVTTPSPVRASSMRRVFA